MQFEVVHETKKNNMAKTPLASSFRLGQFIDTVYSKAACACRSKRVGWKQK